MGVATEAVEKPRLISEREQYFTSWVTWCKAHDREPNIECLMEWDEKHNRSRIREVWKQKEIYAAGLREMYRRFYYTYNVAIVRIGNERTPVSLTPIRRSDEEGSMKFLEDMDEEEREFMVEKIEARVKSDAKRLRILRSDWNWDQIKRFFEEAVTKAEREIRLEAEPGV